MMLPVVHCRILLLKLKSQVSQRMAPSQMMGKQRLTWVNGCGMGSLHALGSPQVYERAKYGRHLNISYVWCLISICSSRLCSGYPKQALSIAAVGYKRSRQDFKQVNRIFRKGLI